MTRSSSPSLHHRYPYGRASSAATEWITQQFTSPAFAHNLFRSIFTHLWENRCVSMITRTYCAQWSLIMPSGLIRDRVWLQSHITAAWVDALLIIWEVFCNNLLQTLRRTQTWCRSRLGFSRLRENFLPAPLFLFLDVCQWDRPSLGNYPPFTFSIMFTFAAFCYMLSLVLCVSLIFFAIWHVSISHLVYFWDFSPICLAYDEQRIAPSSRMYSCIGRSGDASVIFVRNSATQVWAPNTTSSQMYIFNCQSDIAASFLYFPQHDRCAPVCPTLSSIHTSTFLQFCRASFYLATLCLVFFCCLLLT